MSFFCVRVDSDGLEFGKNPLPFFGKSVSLASDEKIAIAKKKTRCTK